MPETIAALRDAGMRVWVLTGDKQETAIEIAKTCMLISPEMSLVGGAYKERLDWCHWSRWAESCFVLFVLLYLQRLQQLSSSQLQFRMNFISTDFWLTQCRNAGAPELFTHESRRRP